MEQLLKYPDPLHMAQGVAFPLNVSLTHSIEEIHPIQYDNERFDCEDCGDDFVNDFVLKHSPGDFVQECT